MDRLTEHFKNGIRVKGDKSYAVIDKLAAYEDTGLTPEEVQGLKEERNALAERLGGTIPVRCEQCELWGSNGWAMHGVGYCAGDEKTHTANDYCSYGVKKGKPND